MEFKVPLSRADITQADIDAVVSVLKSPYLSLGPKLPEFEKNMARYVGTKFAVAVNSGTSGLYVCLKAMGITAGDEVITTPFTFIATANCILMVDAKPVFVDIDPVSYNLDATKIEKAITKKTKAILPVEVFGNPAGMDEIRRIADKHGIPILEDCCEALGSKLNGKPAGTFGQMGVFAFYPNKQMTTGEGGMIVTDDERLAALCVSLRNQGRGAGGGWLAHERLGYNYRLSDINCALGISQLSRIDEFIRKRRAVAAMYQELLAGDDRFVVPTEAIGSFISWFVFVIRLVDRYTQAQRDQLLKMMTQRGIQVNNYFPPVYLQPFIAGPMGLKAGDFPVTDRVSARTMALPFHNNITRQQAEIVRDELRKCLDEIG
ncbi:MAG: DegT/DnrJ/EryC1/StrS family aminotransferase [Phycisphaerae bacterium]|nr:DegT/DnrJ/EryC1/StrS family aminotransferase [Phycisphaerae bacterium]